MTTTPPHPRLWIWWVWLAVFYAAWVGVMLQPGNTATAIQHWPIALTMIFGSFVAGSTPMGGGTVAFPVLVLFFGLPVTLGRDFSFAVQSIGMTSASLFILGRRQRLAWDALAGTLVGSAIGLPLGILLVAPVVPAPAVKLVFALFWALFGIMHLLRLDDIAVATPLPGPDSGRFAAGVLTGFVAGATIVAVTGVGVDMLLYALLVLGYRTDPKIAIPTSVVAMAYNSVLGMAIKFFVAGVDPGVFSNWLAAAPVVALGAPLGAWVVGIVGRRPTLLFVAVLCLVQFAWTVYHERTALDAGLFGRAAPLTVSGQPLAHGWTATREIASPHATQAAAADEGHLYAISNTTVARYDRTSGRLLATATAPGTEHLNSGFFHEGRLCCAHSNYPHTPHESDIRGYDPATDRLELLHRFEHPPGSLVWCVVRDARWWCCFAHYGAANAETVLVEYASGGFDRELRRFTFPPEVVADWDGMSGSGGIWDGDTLLVSHHHQRVLYRLRLPERGTRLELVERLASPFPGQGFAADPVSGGLVGIDRDRRQIVIARPVEPPARPTSPR
jgi:uncharacterized membrane protein YfcA